MKKIINTFAAVIALFIAFSCTRDIVPEPEKTYLDYVIEDYQALVKEFPDAKDHFVEARFVLDDYIANAQPEDLKAETLTTICYLWQGGYSDIFVCERDFESGEVRTANYQADSPWLGDSQIPEADLMGFKVSLEDAIAAAKKEAASGDGLNTSAVTLRKPVYPFFPNAQYVFGGSASRHDHVFVDAKTGEVSIKEGTVPEGSASTFFLHDLAAIADEYDGGQRLGYQLDIKWNLVEVRYELSQKVNAAMLSDLEAIKATYVYYVPAADNHPSYLIKAVRNSFALDATLEYSEETDVPEWTAGKYIDLDFVDAFVGLEEAIASVKLGDVTDPDTNLVVYSHPEGFESPVMQFIGDKTPTVIVDSITGELLK